MRGRSPVVVLFQDMHTSVSLLIGLFFSELRERELMCTRVRISVLYILWSQFRVFQVTKLLCYSRQVFCSCLEQALKLACGP